MCCDDIYFTNIYFRQSHTTTNIPIIMIQIQSMVPVKNGNKHIYPAKITRELLLCVTATTTTLQTTQTFWGRFWHELFETTGKQLL